MSKQTPRFTYFDRDISWLSFNERVLNEAERSTVPLMERIRFLSIYSSNLDEFYRVRVPAIRAMDRLPAKYTEKVTTNIATINNIVMRQQKQFGRLIEAEIVPALLEEGIHLVHKQPIPEMLFHEVEEYFINEVAAYIKCYRISDDLSFFPENNQLYVVVTLKSSDDAVYLVNIPSEQLPRFHSIRKEGKHFVLFLDDIVKHCIPQIFSDDIVLSRRSIKITRDADLNLQDEYVGNLALKIERQIALRDRGLATRFLYEPGMPQWVLKLLTKKFQLDPSSVISGGQYHNLRDLGKIPLHGAQFNWEPWPLTRRRIEAPMLSDEIPKRDLIFHPPYHTYETVLRFFNEAAIDPRVTSVYVTLYRVARDSRIANALISAATNGKKVTVFVELKARFDEENNIRWMKRMRAAGVRIIESIPDLKVHAKVALVKRSCDSGTQLLGLFATGNFNEVTSRFYTDHVLMTSREELVTEADALFKFLRKRTKKTSKDKLAFSHLLVGHFNMQEAFIRLIDGETAHAKAGRTGKIIIKFNNLEDRVLIDKLYEASRAGVTIQLIVRGICCLVPGVAGQSENIEVIRIIDRYLEHGRVFYFHNDGDSRLYLGSADWMNRNIYRRIEVCFPIYDSDIKKVFMDLLRIQLSDNVQGVMVDTQSENIPRPRSGQEVRSQRAIADYVILNLR